MRLEVRKIDNENYTRTITDLQGNLIWHGGQQKYVYDGSVIMSAQQMRELVLQMKSLPCWNIVEVINDFEQH